MYVGITVLIDYPIEVPAGEKLVDEIPVDVGDKVRAVGHERDFYVVRQFFQQRFCLVLERQYLNLYAVCAQVVGQYGRDLLDSAVTGIGCYVEKDSHAGLKVSFIICLVFFISDSTDWLIML